MCLSVNGKIIVGKKGISYKSPSRTTTIIISRVIFEEFLGKLYQVTGFEKLYTGLAVTCRYLVAKEYIELPITDQETLEIAFPVVTPPGK